MLGLCGTIIYILEIIELYKVPGYWIVRYIAHQWIFFDVGINFICLILQFPFSQNVYETYCIYCDNKCQNIVANKVASANEKDWAVIKSKSASNASSNPMSPSHGSSEIIIVS